MNTSDYFTVVIEVVINDNVYFEIKSENKWSAWFKIVILKMLTKILKLEQVHSEIPWVCRYIH